MRSSYSRFTVAAVTGRDAGVAGCPAALLRGERGYFAVIVFKSLICSCRSRGSSHRGS